MAGVKKRGRSKKEVLPAVYDDADDNSGINEILLARMEPIVRDVTQKLVDLAAECGVQVDIKLIVVKR